MKAKKSVIKKAAPLKKVAAKKTVVSTAKALAIAKVNHIIPKALGLEMVTRFQDNIKNLGKATFEIGKEFDKFLFESLLKLKGIKNVRIYNALNNDNSHTFVITGLDKNSNELYFKIKNSPKSKGNVQAKTATPTDDDGVGNMGNQCSEPPPLAERGLYIKR